MADEILAWESISSLQLIYFSSSGCGLVMADEILAWESISSLQLIYFSSSGCGAVG